jgi:hypothetical protein
LPLLSLQGNDSQLFIGCTLVVSGAIRISYQVMATNPPWNKRKLLDIWFTRGEPHKESITKTQFVDAAKAVIHWSSFTDAKNSMSSDSEVRA